MQIGLNFTNSSSFPFISSLKHHLNLKNMSTTQMEGGDQTSVGNGGARWNPTKEQIDMLEGLYKQGLRTPSAEQIQQITTRLKEFGHIEGKNVFYWFQNHKARQRQKQKQENSAAFFNRFITSPAAFPTYHNVVCSPFYNMAPTQSELGLYQQYAKVPIPSASSGSCFKRRLISETPMEKNKQKVMQKNAATRTNAGTEEFYQQETLDLFPMHPTGILQAKNENESFNATTSSANDNWINNEKEAANNGGDGDHPFIDFFHGKYN